MTQARGADVVYTGGTVLTMESDCPRTDALAVQEGKIVAVGGADCTRVKAANTRVVDLKGKTLMPAFVDPHSHLIFTARKLATVAMESPPIANIRSIKDIQDELARSSDRREGDNKRWIIGWGYDHAGLAEGRHPNRHDLDQVSTTQPIFLYHYSAHQAVVNTRALELLHIDASTPDPQAGVIAREADGHTQTGCSKRRPWSAQMPWRCGRSVSITILRG